MQINLMLCRWYVANGQSLLHYFCMDVIEGLNSLTMISSKLVLTAKIMTQEIANAYHGKPYDA